jgi:hypothetical protein
MELPLQSVVAFAALRTARLRPLGFGAAAFATIEACLAVAGGASEGWWGKKDSNLRSHKTADLQSGSTPRHHQTNQDTLQ